MAYSVEADVQIAAGGAVALRRLSDVDGENAINSTVVAAAIEEADALINSYLKKRYGIPVSPVSKSLKWASARLAVYNMAESRNMLTDKLIQAHQLRLEWLEALSTGVAVLDEVSDPTASEFVVAENAERPESKAVSRDKLKGFW